MDPTNSRAYLGRLLLSAVMVALVALLIALARFWRWLFQVS